MKQFNELGIVPNILKAIEEIGHTNPTLVQEKTIPALLKGDDIIILSQTGSGKTLAFGVPALQSVDAEVKAQQVLIICPTRELATQVADEIKRIGQYMEGIKVFAVFGGQPIFKQIEGLKKRPQIIVGTPGRIMDHIDRRTLKLEAVKMLVLDEADEMLKMGFREDIEAISKKLAGHRQSILASATMSKEIKSLTEKFLNNPITIESGDVNSPAKSVHQEYIAINPKNKKQMLVNILNSLDGTALVFCNTKRMTTALYEFLNEQNISAREIHGDMRQSERTKAMNAFKNRDAKILVATDVAARGIDVNNITYVINYDYPEMEEYYIHRIGRTGRAGLEGKAYTFITTSNQMSNLMMLSKKMNFTIINSPLSGDVTYDKSGSTDVGRHAGRGTSSSRKPYGRTAGYSTENKERSFDKKPYGRSENYSSENKEKSFVKKTYPKRDENGFKPFVKKDETGFEKKPYEKKPYEKNEGYSSENKPRTFGKKPYEKREDGSFSKPYEHKTRSFEKKPFVKKDENSSNSLYDNKKTYAKKDDSTFNKSYNKDSRFVKHESSDGINKSYAKKGSYSSNKPYNNEKKYERKDKESLGMETKKNTGFEKFMEKKNAHSHNSFNQANKGRFNQNTKSNPALHTRPSGNKGA